MEEQIPIIYFFGSSPGKYQPITPTFVGRMGSRPSPGTARLRRSWELAANWVKQARSPGE
jgi:hypothetical protein